MFFYACLTSIGSLEGGENFRVGIFLSKNLFRVGLQKNKQLFFQALGMAEVNPALFDKISWYQDS